MFYEHFPANLTTPYAMLRQTCKRVVNLKHGILRMVYKRKILILASLPECTRLSFINRNKYTIEQHGVLLPTLIKRTDAGAFAPSDP